MIKKFLRWPLLTLICLAANSALALQISMTSDTNFNVDFKVGPPALQGDRESFVITDTDTVNYSNLWITLGSFTNTSTMKLGGGEPGQYPLGMLTNTQSGAAFFFVQAIADPGNGSYNNQFTVKVYNGFPATGTLLTSSNFVVTVGAAQSANANKISAITFSPTNSPVVGAIVRISVFGDVGTVGSGNIMDFTDATWTNWNAGVFQLVSCSITVTNGSHTNLSQTLVNALSTTAGSHFTGGNSNPYEADYYLRTIAATNASTPISPVSFIGSGNNNVKHTSIGSGGSSIAFPSVLPATNLTTLTSLTNFTQNYTNRIVTFTLVVSNLSTAYNVTLDRFVDTLPTGFTYVANSSRFGGAPILDPVNSSQVLTWSQPNTYTVPAGTNLTFTFQAIVASVSSPTYFTNSCVAFVQNAQIDTTLDTSDNAPALETVRALITPVSSNVTTNVLENQTLTVAAPGVLANTTDPNGFTLTVLSYAQPAHGSVTVNSNGSYTYTPTAFYWGADSFTFTITNQNGAASTATNNITINWVNQPPYFTEGANQSVFENAGAQTVVSWATGISQGTNDPAQTLTFQVSNNNSNLFSVQPSVSSSGTLTYTPAAFASGSATVTVYLMDNGGTANGGTNASATQTFTITVNAVNQPPYFTEGANQSVFENAGAQTVVSWATGISSGTNDPPQTLTFHTSNNNSNLFSAQPAISSNGTLTYTPAPDQFGSATVTVYLMDNGGTANGGNDTSPSQTFTITVNWVNQPPTLNPLSPVSINEDAPTQTVNLSGISPGPTNESSQIVTITATSSNTGLIPNPTVNYTNPSSTGTLTFAPVTNGFGSATITVVVQDNGGTANGGVNAVTNTFTVTVTEMTTIWGPNGSLTEHVKDALGAPGVGYDEQQLIGNLDITATSTNPYTINLVSLNGATPGLATNFNYNSNFTWTIATTTRGVDGFDPTKFAFNTGGFSNDLAGGSFSVALSSDSNSVYVVFTPAHNPTASPISYGRAYGTTLRLAIPNILTNDTSDVDGVARKLLFVGTSTNGSYIATNGIFIIYAPTNNITEAFNYGVEALLPYRPGDTLRTATNLITISVTNAVGLVQSISVVGGQNVTLTFAGVPGYAYDVQRTTNLANATWTVLWTTSAPPNGVWTFIDTNPPPNSAYYRTAQH